MCRSYSLLHLYNPIQIPVREFKIEKDAERNKTELRNERSFCFVSPQIPTKWICGEEEE